MIYTWFLTRTTPPAAAGILRNNQLSLAHTPPPTVHTHRLWKNQVCLFEYAQSAQVQQARRLKKNQLSAFSM